MGGLGLRDLRKSFGAHVVLDGVGLDVAEGETLAILGPSGCGKTTLLRLIAGLEAPDAGRITIRGKDATKIDARARNVAMVFQDHCLYPTKTVLQNVMFPQRLRGLSRRESHARAMEMLALVEMDGFAQSMPATLSGGQAQRVAVARALVRDPDVVLLDEPLASLDAPLRRALRIKLRALLQNSPAASVFVTHDPQEAMALGDRIAVMHGGKIAQIGPAQEVYDRPATVFVAEFFGAPGMSVLRGHVENGVFLAPDVALPVAGAPIAGAAYVALRADAIKPAQTGAISARVVAAENTGAGYLVHLDAAGQGLCAHFSSRPDAAQIAVSVAPEEVHLFDAAGHRVM